MVWLFIQAIVMGPLVEKDLQVPTMLRMTPGPAGVVMYVVPPYGSFSLWLHPHPADATNQVSFYQCRR